MRTRIAILSISLIVIAALGVFSAMPFALAQDDDDQQATIDALVEQRFQETLAASSGPEMTMTAEAAMTMTFEAAVEQAFNQALTATAEAAGGGDTDAVAPVVPDAQAAAVAVEVVFEAKGDPDDESMERAAEVMRNRLRELDIEGFDIDQNDERITLELPPLVNYSDVITSVQQTGLLEFVDFSGLNDQINDFVGQQIVTSANESRRDDVDEARPEAALLNPLTDDFFETVVTSGDIRSAEARPGQVDNELWDVVFEFRDEAGEEMLDFSSDHVGQPLAIVLDGEVLTDPVIQSPFGTAGGLISGGFDQEQAERLVLQLEVGSMPVSLTVVRVESLTAGADVALNASPTVSGPTPTPRPSPTPDLRPTATRGEVQIAEQVFENGRIFWVQPTGQLWVMFGEEEGGGEWGVFEDTFTDGEPETDPSLVPPEGFFQPERGFGKLWRGNPEVRDRLGWAVTPEFGYVSDYFYQPGGEIVGDTYTPGPGHHVLFTLYKEAIRFNEDTSTWELNTIEDDDN
jgi:hypothetical protein